MLADMDDGAEQWVAIVEGLDEARANELALVLIARGIAHQRQRAPAGIEIWVPVASASAAATELGQYRRENSRRVGARPLDHVAGSAPAVLAYVGALLAVFVAGHESLFGRDWYGAGLLQASAVGSAELWRTITALTLHVEPDHLTGNLAFGAFFGWFVGRYFGAGVGWLAVLASGAAANTLGAWFAAADHRSLGASTAVFAAVGMLTAYTWRRGYWRATPWRARIAPVVAGLGLLAFTGTAGENTDLGAHLLGFAAGFACGLGFARWWTPAALRSARLQSVCAAAAVIAVVAAWTWGLLAAG
jgi:rhomboid protease GluP